VVATGLEATRENLVAAKRLLDEHKARLLLGEESEQPQNVSFEKASERFLEHKVAKHRDKPATANRARGSLSSWKAFMGQRMIWT